MKLFARIGSLALLAVSSMASVGMAADSSDKLTEKPDKIIVEIGGKPFTEYLYTAEGGRKYVRPFFYPVLAPDGTKLTSDQTTFNPKEHPHHRSMWVAQGDVNGVDHWAFKGDAPAQQKHVKFEKIDGDTIVELLEWLDESGKPLLKEHRTWKFFAYPDESRGVDLTSVYTPASGPVTFKETKEAGLIAVRVAPEISANPIISQANGVVSKENADKKKKIKGDEDNVWGKKSPWCDITGQINGKTYGVAIFDNPANPRYPTNWHVRRYGLMAANIFGLHDFDKSVPQHSGDFTLDKPTTFKYRVVYHTGDIAAAKIEEKFKEYSGK